MNNPIYRHYVLIVALLTFVAALIVVLSEYQPSLVKYVLVGWFVLGPIVLRWAGKCLYCGELIPHVKWFDSHIVGLVKKCSKCGKEY